MSMYAHVDEVPLGADPTCEGCGHNEEGTPRCNATREQKSGSCQFTVMQMAKASGRGNRVSALVIDMESSLSDIYEDLGARGVSELGSEFREDYERKLRSSIIQVVESEDVTDTERVSANDWLCYRIQDEFDRRVYR